MADANQKIVRIVMPVLGRERRLRMELDLRWLAWFSN